MFDLKRARTLLAIIAALCVLSLAAACGGGDDEDDDIAGDEAGTSGSATAGGPKYAPTGKEGTLTGSIALTGTAPEPKPISMDQDPVCASSNPNAVSQDVVVAGGKVGNVFVYVKDGKTADGKSITNFSFDPPGEPRILDQKGCQYLPHVVGIQTGQKLSVTNSDPTAHNVNVQGNKNPKFNQSQPPSAAPIEKTFTQPEVLVPVKCNQHPWMKSYIGVMRHPFYAVSGADGKFEIKGLPPGTYNVVAWHERFGEKPMSVTVGDGETKTQDFSFAAATASDTLQGGSLRVMPALDFPMLGRHH